MPQSSLPIPLRESKPIIKKEKVKEERESKPRPTALNLVPEVEAETDEQMAARLQAEYDSLNSGRASRSTGGTGRNGTKGKKKAVGKKRKKEDVEIDSDGNEVKKKRKGGGGGAFNKELILR